MVEPEVFRKQFRKYWRKCMWYWDFSAPSAMIRCPLQWIDARGIVPPSPPIVTPLARRKPAALCAIVLLIDIQQTSVNPDSSNPDLRQNRMQLVVRMISNVFLYKNRPFIRIFHPDLRQNRMQLVVRMISNVFLYKNRPFIRIFHPDLRQYRIKSARFTSRNRILIHSHAVVFLKCIHWSLAKIRHLSGATQACSRSPTNV